MAPMVYGTTYYISAIVGNDQGGGVVDQADPCLDVAPGTAVTWIETPTANFSGDASICQGSSTPLTFNLTGTGPFNVTYTNGTSNFTVANIADGATVNVSPNTSTNYNLVSVSSANTGCAGTVANTQVSVVVNTAPVATIPTYTCNPTGTGYFASFDASGGSGTYAVINSTHGGDFTGNTFTSDLIPSGDVFTVNFDDGNNCGPVTVTGTHTCDCETNAGTMGAQKIEICGDGSANATHNNSTVNLDPDDVLEFVLHDGSSNVLGNVIATNGIPSFSFNAPMNYGTVYYISAVAGNDDGTGSPDPNDPCFNVAVGTPVEWNQIPTTTASVANDQVCEGDDIELFSTNNTGNETFLWSGPSSYASADQNPVITGATPDMSGTYTVTIRENGCSSTSTVDVNVTPVQNPDISDDPNDPFCETDDEVTLTAASAGGTWTGNGITDGTAGTFDPTTAGPGIHTITYTIDGQCPATDTRDIEVIATPVPTYTANPPSGCSPLVVDFENTTANSTSVVWDFGNGNSSMSDVTSTTYNPGSYNVSMTVTVDGCVGTQTFTNAINVDPTPVAAFDAKNTGKGNFDFENNSTGAVDYAWDFGDGSTSNEENPSYDYGDQTGSFDVTLTVTSAQGCTHTVTMTVTIEEEVIFYVPNSFTPNGDAVNQYFEPVISSGIDVLSYELKIYNRYGELIFTSNDPAIGWDGTYQNKIVPTGVYIWQLSFDERERDSRHNYEGIVSVL